MVRVIAGLGLGACLLLLPAFSAAQVYTCTDKNGKFIIADRLLKECANRPVKELDKRGMPVRDIAAPMSEAERKQQEIEDNKRSQMQAKEEDRQRQDQALMARYKSEQEIDMARKKEIAQIEQRIAESDAATLQAEKQLHAAQNETGQFKQGNVPDTLQKRIKDAQFLIDEQKKLATANRREKAQINARYAETLQKFRDITSENAK